MTVEGKVVVVTGASMGIGEAIAKIFADYGASVVISSRDAGRAEAARGRIGHTERTVVFPCDVRRTEDVQMLVRRTVQRFGRVDVWVNNAGFGLIDSVAAMDMNQCKSMFATNLFGAIDAMQAVIPVMQQQGSGTMINISSVAGHIAVPYMAGYCATKHALNAMGNAARLELQGSGVHVMTVCPGYIATDFSKNAVKGEGAQRLSAAAYRISPERVARAVLNGYFKNKREVVVPWRDRIAVSLYKFFPKLIESAMTRMLRPANQVLDQAQAARKKS